MKASPCCINIAMASNFIPYGLIRTPIQHHLYVRAHIANVFTGIADPKESQTVALMQVLLYKNIFYEDNFIVNSEQPPSTASGHRCDLVVRYLETGTDSVKALCFAECKRSRTNQPFALKLLEDQAKDYCRRYLRQQQTSTFVYAATMAGAHVRLWKCTADEMIPFWGTATSSNWRHYKDVGVDADAAEISRVFEHMKQFPPTPHSTQTSHTYGSMSQPVQTLGSSGPSRGGALPLQVAQGRSSSSATGQQLYRAEPSASHGGPSASSDPQYESGGSEEDREPDVVTLPLRGGQPVRFAESRTMGQQPYHSGPAASYGEPSNPPDDLNPQMDEEEEDVAQPSYGAQTSTRKFREVTVTVVTHLLQKKEYAFTYNGKRRVTQSTEWRKSKVNGRTAWLYDGERTTYFSHQRLG
jgi:hypothetical protein